MQRMRTNSLKANCWHKYPVNHCGACGMVPSANVVMILAPSSVIATVCSNWAERLMGKWVRTSKDVNRGAQDEFSCCVKRTSHLLSQRSSRRPKLCSLVNLRVQRLVQKHEKFKARLV